MIQRILALSLYLFRSLPLSLSGLLYVLMALVFYLIFFQPGQRTPDVDYFILLIGVFGASLAFLVTLTVASRAHRASHLPLVVRLPSRPEYITAVGLASFLFAGTIQALLALVALAAARPQLTLLASLDIPPIWLAVNVLFITLALLASDLVTAGWSRVYIFGSLAVLLLLRQYLSAVTEGLAGVSRRLASTFLDAGVDALSSPFFAISNWLITSGQDIGSDAIGLIFWPFEAIINAVRVGAFSSTQALAPAVLLLYATVLYILAADLFAGKDLLMTE
ncbi:MAG: hypothetical protein R3300_21190 [Candidatus Promineifilaceae bacterium]|nr:hypothetical protein [Candidatus Promineifilaceae bacterium]